MDLSESKTVGEFVASVHDVKEREKAMKKLPVAKFICSLLLGLALVLASYVPARAGTFTWSGAPIVGENPAFLPSGNAVFEISGSTLTLTLTNDSPLILSIGEALSGLTWDITDPGVTLVGASAVIASGSSLVGVGATGDTDLSGEWAFKDDISAGISPSGAIGSFGIGSMGDINFGTDTFGIFDRFDTSTNVFGIENLNGIDGAIVGPSVNLFSDGFNTQGPLVQNQMVFTFNITSGTLTQDEIMNVQSLFGTDGAPAVAEPATLLLLGSGLLGMGLLRRKMFKG